MVIVQFAGGHSNQMFQYAAARSLALQNNTELRFSMEWFKHMEGVKSPRHFELDAYNIVGKIQSRGFAQRVVNKFKRVQYFEQRDFSFDPAFRSLGPNVYLIGDFQSEKYFKDIRSVLLEDFSYKKPAHGKNAMLLKTINNDPTAVSLHIRRGDYVNDAETNAMHGVAALSYYERALTEIKKKVKNPTLYVITNDPAWCRENLKLDASMHIVDHDNVGAEDMRLMRACKHNILANSSFSWWGAWLNENEEKIVIAPKKWFNDSTIDTADLLPKEWITL